MHLSRYLGSVTLQRKQTSCVPSSLSGVITTLKDETPQETTIAWHNLTNAEGKLT